MAVNCNGSVLGQEANAFTCVEICDISVLSRRSPRGGRVVESFPPTMRRNLQKILTFKTFPQQIPSDCSKDEMKDTGVVTRACAGHEYRQSHSSPITTKLSASLH